MLLFQATIFVSASLLFLVQPMFAKLTLPRLGGTPAVWNTCMLFFQLMLLVGYAYAHASAKWLTIRRGMVLHLVILFGVLLLPALAIHESWKPPADQSPVLWLLGVLALSVGGPFFAVSATSPLLQRWFAAASHSKSDDPYFLYSASNVGSFAALIAYPLLLERVLDLEQQSNYWRIGYGLFVVLMAGCAVVVLRDRKRSRSTAHEHDAVTSNSDSSTPAKPLSWRRRFHWTWLAFLASSWLLGVTQHITTDLAPVPLLWIIPLSLYLLSFVLVFASKPPVHPDVWVRAFPFLMIVIVISVIFLGTWQWIPLHLAAFFVGIMVCHGDLAADRPSVEHLTEFYLLISLGGVLGGFFNAILAPLLFPVALEYPLIVSLACASRATLFPGGQKLLDSRGNYVGFALMLAAIALLASTMEFRGTVNLMMVVLFAVPLLMVFCFFALPRWFAAAVAVVLLANAIEPPFAGDSVFVGRSYFGVHRVLHEPRIHQYRLLHGSTIHGIQTRHPRKRELEKQPLAYYSNSGPLGQVLLSDAGDQLNEVGVIGLGAGAVAAYTAPGRTFTLFEIDPVVAQVAQDPDLFTYLANCGRENYKIVLGDGRRSLADTDDQSFDLLFFDAFSSDAIPMHLLTREAIELYGAKLSPRGYLLFHVSNSHLDLRPVLSSLAHDAGWLGRVQTHSPTADELAAGVAGSTYVVLARDQRGLDQLALGPQWQRLPDPTQDPWTDKFSNLVDAIKWGQD